jgi:hypothetical protein
MMQVDPWEKAAEIGRAIRAAKDPHRRAVLSNLQKLWITLGNEEGFLPEGYLVKQTENVCRLHAEFLAQQDRETPSGLALS